MTQVNPDNAKQFLAALVAKTEPPSRPQPEESFAAEAPVEAPDAAKEPTAEAPVEAPDGAEEPVEAAPTGEQAVPAADAHPADSTLLDRVTRDNLASAAPDLLPLIDTLTATTATLAMGFPASSGHVICLTLRA